MSTEPTTYPCKVRLTAESEIALVSPKTGRVAYAKTGKMPARLRSRIVKAISVGEHAVTLTLDDLKAFAAVAVLPSTKPIVLPAVQPAPLWGGWRRGCSRSFSRRR